MSNFFTGPLNGSGYTQTSQHPTTPCDLAGCTTVLTAQAALFVSPTDNVSAALQFGDAGFIYDGAEPVTYGWILNDFQGGPPSAPASLSSSPGPVAEITGSFTEETMEVYYDFLWRSGAFSVTGTVPDGASGASYLLSVGVAGTCSSAGSVTLNYADSFTGTIAIANLAAGEYCVGISTDSPIDPSFALIFNTPVTDSSMQSSAPEPSGFVLLSIGALMIGLRRLGAKPALIARSPSRPVFRPLLRRKYENPRLIKAV